MESTTTRTAIGHRKLGRIALASVLIALIGGLSAVAPARADNDRGRDVRHRHEHRRPAHRPNGYGAPEYIYAPPPVYYAPPPQPPPIDLVFPLIFR